LSFVYGFLLGLVLTAGISPGLQIEMAFARLIFGPTRAALPAAAGHFIDRGPGAFYRRLCAHTTLFVAFLDVTGHALLFSGVTGFITLWHKNPFRLGGSLSRQA
jgi:hypothetical protein